MRRTADLDRLYAAGDADRRTADVPGRPTGRRNTCAPDAPRRWLIGASSMLLTVLLAYASHHLIFDTGVSDSIPILSLTLGFVGLSLDRLDSGWTASFGLMNGPSRPKI